MRRILNRKGKILACLFAAALLLLTFLSPAPQTASADVDSNYYFYGISTHIVVHENKTYDVTETMYVGFRESGVNTGIIRDIQRISQTTRIIDGVSKSGYNYISKISNVEVTINGEPARVTQSLYDNGNYYSVKMQKKDGEYFNKTDADDWDTCNTFVLKYVYDASDDKAKGYDDFTFDVLGYAMAKTMIFMANIVFPNPVENYDISFRTNYKETWEPDSAYRENISIEGNTVSMVATPLSANKGYTVQVIMPDGTFQLSGRTFFWYYIPFCVIAALAVVAGILFFISLAPRKPIEQIEFYPPDGMRPMRFSAIYHGSSRLKDVSAVIMKWADEGCVTLVKDGRSDLIVRKLKELPQEATASERAYFDAMFPGENEFSTRAARNRVAYISRTRKMYNAASQMGKEADVPDPLYPHSKRMHILLTVAALVPMISFLIYLCILCATAMPLFCVVFMCAGTAVGSSQARDRTVPIAYIFPIVFMGFPFFMVWGLFYLSLYDYAGLLWIALAWWAVALVLLHFTTRRSDDAQKQLGKILGFKRFLLTAELSRIQRMFDDNPEYFSNIIPYCLIMGISKKVEKRFATLNVPMPQWAQGIPISSIAMVSRSLSRSSGGGSSGGGHGGSSGGGGGGGGSRGC